MSRTVHVVSEILRPRPRPRPRPRRAALVVATGTALLLSCGSPSTTTLPFDGRLPLGTWGGDSAGLIVGDTAMHLHIGCTYGDVSGRIPVESNGHFDVAGTYMLRAYPIAIGPSVPARFVGRLDGSTVSVTVTVDDTVQHQTVVRGPVVVRFGDEPRLGPCPICRRPVTTALMPHSIESRDSASIAMLDVSSSSKR